MSNLGTVTVDRAALLIAAWDTYGEELGFVENADGSCVHVAAGSGKPRWAEHGRPSDSDSGDKSFGLSFEEILDLEMGAVYTVCGLRVRCNRGGHDEGGRMTNAFRDELLCVRCHRAFGDRADLIFECNRLPDPED